MHNELVKSKYLSFSKYDKDSFWASSYPHFLVTGQKLGRSIFGFQIPDQMPYIQKLS